MVILRNRTTYFLVLLSYDLSLFYTLAETFQIEVNDSSGRRDGATETENCRY